MSTDVYYIELIDVVKLRQIASRLMLGNDQERDEGHKIWLIIQSIENCPVKPEHMP
jgi:hypothetical protein